ncbi:LPS export ABC transporter permease LptG [Sandarakinorhabdus sp.]|jgi:lipopolysaccharide export system permease protein|uniref:LPS export ABC transporter permease LptG n=1 Tax=Sandarakinorhabdus sp. TaxID=1916663 RepID=UPI00333F8838
MAIFPSRTIAWYTARMFLVRVAAFMIGLTVILQALDLLSESGKVLAAPGNTEADLWLYVSLRAPQIIQLFLPFSVLLATLVTLATLNQNSEVVIFKAAGLSAHHILAPLMLAALGVAIANFAWNERVGTRASATLKAWQDNEFRKLPVAAAKPGQSWVRGGDDLFHAERVTGRDNATNLSGVTIYDRRDNRLVQVVMAASAVPMRGGWRLADVRLFDVASGGLETRPRLDFATDVVPRQFTTISINPNFIALWDLWPQISEQRAAGKPTDVLEAAAWHKISGPLSAVLMPLLGAVAAFGLARSGKLFVRAVIGMALGFAFFVADNFMLAMGNFGTVPPVMAAWAPFLLFLLIGEAVLIRTEE